MAQEKRREKGESFHFRISFSLSLSFILHCFHILASFLCMSFKRTMWLVGIKIEGIKETRKELFTWIERKGTCHFAFCLVGAFASRWGAVGNKHPDVLFCCCCYSFLYMYRRSKSWGTDRKKGKICRKKCLHTKPNSQTSRQKKKKRKKAKCNFRYSAAISREKWTVSLLWNTKNKYKTWYWNIKLSENVFSI